MYSETSVIFISELWGCCCCIAFSPAEAIESDSWVGVDVIVLSLPHSVGMVGSRCGCLLTAGSQGAVVLGNGLLYCQVAVAGRDSYGFVFPARVTALLSCPFAPYPILMAFTPALTPGSPRAGSAYEHMCVHPSSGCVHGPRPIRLASTDVTGLEEC